MNTFLSLSTCFSSGMGGDNKKFLQEDSQENLHREKEEEKAWTSEVLQALKRKELIDQS